MRCNIDALIKKVGIDKLSKEIEATFSLHRNLPDCRKIDTRKYVGTDDTGTLTYNSLKKPANRFECLRKGCVNTGLLMMNTASKYAEFKAQWDGTEYAAGAIAFYVYAGDLQSSAFPIALTVTVSDTQAAANADVYTRSLAYSELTEDGFIPVVIDLSKTPSSTEGNGWTAGAVTYIKLAADKIVGYSSISIYDSIDVFESNDVVKVGCLSTLGGSFDVNAITSTCLNAGYDDTVDSFNYTVEGTTVTPNYWKLNPMIGKGTETEGFEIVTSKKTVVAATGYGKITLSDLFQDECGYVTVQKAEECNITDSFFKQISVPTLIALAEDQFQVIKNADGTTDLFFNSAAVGAELLVSYPRMADVEEEVMTADNIGEVRARMSIPVTTTDGVNYIYIFDNVLITSFPFTINNSGETTFSFTISIQRDEDGVFVRRRRILG